MQLTLIGIAGRNFAKSELTPCRSAEGATAQRRKPRWAARERAPHDELRGTIAPHRGMAASDPTKVVLDRPQAHSELARLRTGLQRTTQEAATTSRNCHP